MFKQILFFSIFFNINISSYSDLIFSHFKNITSSDADWAIIGAGPAGIATIGVLLDLGIKSSQIIWVDPEFNVGRLSEYPTVPANSKTKDFVQFLESCKAFQRISGPAIDKIKALNQEKQYPLQVIIDPLKEITDGLKAKVKAIKGDLQSLYFENNTWKIKANNKTYSSRHVVLATGSHPKTLNLIEHKSKEIPLDKALDKTYLQQILKPEDIVAVLGSAHSAILILKYLSEIPLKKIINFYNKPIQYMEDINGLIHHGESGIKGIAAHWAKNFLEKNLIANLVRFESKEENLKQILPTCTKIIYAIGFERNELPFIKENPSLQYNETNGIIAPRLFGIGIAFPEKSEDPAGGFEYKVGLNSFIEYAQKIVPFWMQCRNIKNIETLRKFEKLFEIHLL